MKLNLKAIATILPVIALVASLASFIAGGGSLGYLFLSIALFSFALRLFAIK